MSLIICPKCKKEISDTDQNCIYCEELINNGNEMTGTQHCEACGNIISVSDNRCPVCGHARTKEKMPKQKKLKIILVSVIIFIVIIVLSFSNICYYSAGMLENLHRYDTATFIYEKLGNYKDCNEKTEKCKLNKALYLIQCKKYIEAKKILKNLPLNEEVETSLRRCNHMLLYDYILENGKPYKDKIQIEHPDQGFIMQTEENNQNIDMLFSYLYDDGAEEANVFLTLLPGNKNIEIAYLSNSDDGDQSGEGTFFPHLYDGTQDHTECLAEDHISRTSTENMEKLVCACDFYASPYIDMEIIESGYDFASEIRDNTQAAIFYYDLPWVLEVVDECFKSMDCGVRISDFGVNLNQ